MMMAGQMHPPFLFSLSWQRKEKRAVHGPKRKENAGREFAHSGKFRQRYGGCPQTVPGNLAASIRVQLTAYLAGALTRICDCLRGVLLL